MATEKGYWNGQFIKLLGLEISIIFSSTCPAEHVGIAWFLAIVLPLAE
jgi:hypothetical protein